VKGFVDEFGRALLRLPIRAGHDAESAEILAWIDTAFNGELVIPRQMIQDANLVQSGAIEARLADGKTVLLESFTCLVDWFGETRTVEVIANEGEYSLLGIGLLLQRKLTIDYKSLALLMD
jgi:clan AA aspartic protease